MPILSFSKFSMVNIYLRKRRCESERQTQNLIHLVIFKYISQILSPFGAFYFDCQIECVERLPKIFKLKSWKNEKSNWDSPCHLVEYQSGDVPLGLNFRYLQDLVRWVSIQICQDTIQKVNEKLSYTVLFWKAAVKYCIPCCSILFRPRSRLTSVCKRSWIQKKQKENEFHCIISKCISKMLRALIFNLISIEIELNESLAEVMRIQ
jgi:hypothetical protein